MISFAVNDSDWQRKWLIKFAEYFSVGGIALLILYRVMELDKADIRIPFAYGGDSQTLLLFIKSIVEEGWVLNNHSVGMPYGYTLYDFPLSETVTFLLVKFFALFTSNHNLIFNLFFLIHFPLTAVASFFVFRHFGIRRLIALVGALLYTFIPYHLTRSQGHCFYSGFYAVPLFVLVLLWIAEESLSLNEILNWKQHSKKILGSLLICALLASTGTFYYAFFGCGLLLSIGIMLVIRHKKLQKIILPTVLIGFIVLILAMNVFPNLLYFYKNGTVGVVERSPADAETMGLKISQLILPTNGHRIKALAEIKTQYDTQPFTTENKDSSLGFFGTIGFIFLLGMLVYRRPRETEMQAEKSWQLLEHLSVLNITAVLVATIGGFGALVAFFALPQIRSYNRIVVFIAFFAYFAVVFLCNALAEKYETKPRMKIVGAIVLGIVLYLGILDQVSPLLARMGYEGLKSLYQGDEEFISRVESSLPTGAMIFQFPYIPFPEGGTLGSMADYDLLKGYLHSKNLRWSYAAMRGRSSDLWQQQLISKPLPEQVKNLAYAGFNAIYIDRAGYEDKAAAMEDQLHELLQVNPMISNNQRLSVYDLTAYARKLQSELPPSEWTAKHEAALHPLFFSWAKGFYGSEGSGENTWRWCKKQGDLRIINTGSRPKVVNLTLKLKSENPGKLSISSDFFNEALQLSQAPVTVEKSLTIPPGQHTIHFSCDARKVNAPNDSRELVFNVVGFNWKTSE